MFLLCQHQGDCDGDGVTNADEVNGTDGDPTTTEDNTNPFDPCDLNEESITLVPTTEIVCGELEIPEAFTPGDGDGVNDTWVIPGIMNYPNNEVMVFNRWGSKVYTAKGYMNDWTGEMNFGIQLSDNTELPTGTYYYVIDLGDGTEAITGFVFIQR